jgi:hypothetical protein
MKYYKQHVYYLMLVVEIRKAILKEPVTGVDNNVRLGKKLQMP